MRKSSEIYDIPTIVYNIFHNCSLPKIYKYSLFELHTHRIIPNLWLLMIWTTEPNKFVRVNEL